MRTARSTAISRPSAVAISACATPDVTCVGATRLDAADHVERLHHAGDRAEQAHQRRRGHHRLEHPQSARERFSMPPASSPARDSTHHAG